MIALSGAWRAATLSYVLLTAMLNAKHGPRAALEELSRRQQAHETQLADMQQRLQEI